MDEVIEQAGLQGVARRRAGGYSLGMRQRLGIAAAMLGNPDAIMLDEPFNGMDPEGIVWMRGFLRSLAASGRAVLVSSHLMSELQDTADHLVVVGRGQVIADTTVASLLAAASGDQVTLRTSARPQATTVLENAGATVVASGQDVLTISGLPAERVVALLGAAAVPFSEVSAHRATLEQAYMELTRQAVEFRPAGFDAERGAGGAAMTSQVISVPRPEAGPGDGPRGGGFGSLLRAEWIKFRSVRGWVIGMILAGLLTIFLGVFAAANASIGCQMNGGPAKTGKACLPYIPHGPGGEIVTDSFYFVHQPLTGNGTLTAEVTSLTGEHADLASAGRAAQVGSGLVPGLAEWAKAGIIIKRSTHQGSAYAAMMVTGAHGVRMQDNFTGDTAGMPGAVSAAHPRWLRLTRSGDTITGYDSADGTHWTQVGRVQLTGLPSTVQAGMFATSPGYTVTQNSFGGSSNSGGPAQATGVFDHVSLAGGASGAPGPAPRSAAGARPGEDRGQAAARRRSPGTVAATR